MTPAQSSTIAKPKPTVTPQKPRTGAPIVDKNNTKNISSNETAKDEINEIAAELKQELVDSTEQHKGKSEVHPEEGDTIFIDRDGTFHISNEPTKASG